MPPETPSTTTRAVVYSKDIVVMTGLRPETAQKMLRKIRKAFHKPNGMYVTVEEFCAFTGLDDKTVRRYLL